MGELILEANAELTVTRYTRGLIGPDVTPAGRIKNGGRIHAIAPPGCWGPMITPTFRGGHEVTAPVAVEGAEVGDGIALFIEKEWIRSTASASGVMTTDARAFGEDPFVDKHCPGCGKAWPDYVVEGTGERAVRCVACGAVIDTFGFDEGYTVVFDAERRVGITVTEEIAHRFALEARDLIALPATSEQVPILLYQPGRMPSTLMRLRPSIGNIGSTPTRTLPDSHNAGDFGHGLIGASHAYGLSEQELMAAKTDGHLDCMDVRPGAVLIVPVKVPGGGIYLGDAHAVIGEGEIALHGIDITAEVTVRAEVIKGLGIDGPLLLPMTEDLPFYGRPFSTQDYALGDQLSQSYGLPQAVRVGPIQVLGTGATINSATDNAVTRAARLFGISEAEVRNRCTISGGVKIARLPGAVQLTLLMPFRRLDAVGLGDLVRRQYALA
jgi:acetamidase/formamidase